MARLLTRDCFSVRAGIVDGNVIEQSVQMAGKTIAETGDTTLSWQIGESSWASSSGCGIFSAINSVESARIEDATDVQPLSLWRDARRHRANVGLRPRARSQNHARRRSFWTSAPVPASWRSSPVVPAPRRFTPSNPEM